MCGTVQAGRRYWVFDWPGWRAESRRCVAPQNVRESVERCPSRRAANIHDFVIGLPDRYERIAGERGPRFCAAESSDGSVRESRMYADATLEILRRPDGEVVILSPAGQRQSLDGNQDGIG